MGTLMSRIESCSTAPGFNYTYTLEVKKTKIGQILHLLPGSWGCQVPQRWRRHLRCVLPALLPSPAPSPPGTAPCHQTRWPAAGPSLRREVRHSDTRSDKVHLFAWANSDVSVKLEPGSRTSESTSHVKMFSDSKRSDVVRIKCCFPGWRNNQTSGVS